MHRLHAHSLLINLSKMKTSHSNIMFSLLPNGQSKLYGVITIILFCLKVYIYSRVRVEISNQGRNPSTFAATFKKKKGPVRSGFTFFGNKNNAPRQNPGKTGFKKKFDRVKGEKVSPKNNSSRENSPHEDYSRKQLLRSKSREYSIPKSYSSRDNKRETCHEERFEFKREIKTEEKWSYSSYKEERPALR